VFGSFSPGAVAHGLLGGIGLDLMLASLTPHDQRTRAEAALPSVIGAGSTGQSALTID
jgi:hypothetical protein